MIRSMTGFGRGECKGRYGRFIAEIRTYNHKFLEPTFKLPNNFVIFEDKIKDMIKDSVKRGKLYLNITHEGIGEEAEALLIDEKLAKKYYKQLSRLKRQLGAAGDVRMSDIMNFPGILNYKMDDRNINKFFPYLGKAIQKALERLVADREREGELLYKDLSRRVDRIQGIVADIKANSVSNVENYKKKLSARVKELTGGQSIDKARLAVEVALFAKNCDISEELTRLTNHLINFKKTILKRQEVGKKLDFIAQELHREINTVGSKSSDFRISKGVIEVKTEIEKIREQLKNIE